MILSCYFACFFIIALFINIFFMSSYSSSYYYLCLWNSIIFWNSVILFISLKVNLSSNFLISFYLWTLILPIIVLCFAIYIYSRIFPCPRLILIISFVIYLWNSVILVVLSSLSFNFDLFYNPFHILIFPYCNFFLSIFSYLHSSWFFSSFFILKVYIWYSYYQLIFWSSLKLSFVIFYKECFLSWSFLLVFPVLYLWTLVVSVNILSFGTSLYRSSFYVFILDCFFFILYIFYIFKYRVWNVYFAKFLFIFKFFLEFLFSLLQSCCFYSYYFKYIFSILKYSFLAYFWILSFDLWFWNSSVIFNIVCECFVFLNVYVLRHGFKFKTFGHSECLTCDVDNWSKKNKMDDKW